MTQSEILEWIKVTGPIVFSWPVVGLLAVLIFRKPTLKIFEQLTQNSIRRARFGPVEIEQELTRVAEQGQQAVSKLNRLVELGAESRLVELEITASMFGGLLPPEQQQKMREHIKEYRSLTGKDSIPDN